MVFICWELSRCMYSSIFGTLPVSSSASSRFRISRMFPAEPLGEAVYFYSGGSMLGPSAAGMVAPHTRELLPFCSNATGGPSFALLGACLVVTWPSFPSWMRIICNSCWRTLSDPRGRPTGDERISGSILFMLFVVSSPLGSMLTASL